MYVNHVHIHVLNVHQVILIVQNVFLHFNMIPQILSVNVKLDILKIMQIHHLHVLNVSHHAKHVKIIQINV